MRYDSCFRNEDRMTLSKSLYLSRENEMLNKQTVCVYEKILENSKGSDALETWAK